jgi:hypothetical protein
MPPEKRLPHPLGGGADLRVGATYFGSTELLIFLNAFIENLRYVKNRRVTGDLEHLAWELEFLDIYDEAMTASPLFPSTDIREDEEVDGRYE